MKSKKLYRSSSDRVIAGVLGGLGEYLNTDTNFLRLLWIIITVFSGFIPGIIVYLLAAIIIPKQ
jgi:phage shock protein C